MRVIVTKKEGYSVFIEQNNVRNTKMTRKARWLIMFVADASKSMILNQMNATEEPWASSPRRIRAATQSISPTSKRRGSMLVHWQVHHGAHPLPDSPSHQGAEGQWMVDNFWRTNVVWKKKTEDIVSADPEEIVKKDNSVFSLGVAGKAKENHGAGGIDGEGRCVWLKLGCYLLSRCTVTYKLPKKCVNESA